MRRYIFLVLLMIFAVSGFAQNVKSGIGTTNPQQTLHVAGATSTAAIGTTGVSLIKPTVRVEGLNSTNNVAHNAADGTNSLKRVYANQSGDLVLIAEAVENFSFQQFGDVYPNTNLTGNAISSLGSLNFTLKHPAVVYFSATVAASAFNTLGGNLADGSAKVIGTRFRFTAAPAGVATATDFGANVKTYENISTGVNGPIVLNSRAYLQLPAGTYTVAFYGNIGGNTFPYSANFGTATTGENFVVNIIPTSYQ